MRFAALTLMMLASAICYAEVAKPPTPAAKQEAATRFERGVKLYKTQDYSAALAEFEAAYRAVQRFEVLFNIGLAQKKLFQYGESVRALRRYLDEGRGKIPADKVELVQKELAEIKALVAEVTIEVPGMPADVEVDGKLVAQTPLTDPLLLRSGRHVIGVKREGYEPTEKTIDVISSSQMTVKLEMRERVEVSTAGKLTVRTRPPGGEITIDGKVIGKEPWSGTIDPGGHEMIVKLFGYQKNRLEVVLNPGQERELTVDLVPLPKKKPWYKRGAFWAPVVIGTLAVAGGVTAAVVLTRSQPDVTIPYPPRP